MCRRLLSFMPSNNLEDPPRMPFNSRIKSDSDMNSIVPVDPKIAYDVRDIVAAFWITTTSSKYSLDSRRTS